MEPEGSLLCSQGPTTGYYPEPDKPSPHPPILFPLDIFQSYYLSIHAYVFQVIFSLQVFQPKYCMNFSSLPCVLHVLHIPSSII